MNDEILRHYALTEPFSDKWQDVDTSLPSQSVHATESDALGTGQSVSQVLYERGVLRTDNGVPPEYSTSSRDFDARAYIRNIHRQATQNDLLRGQNHLETAIESKAGSLKVLVEDNFDRFVGSKRVIDNVHTQISGDFARTTKSPSESRMEAAKKVLNDCSVKAYQVFDPVIENHRKADRLRVTLGILEQYSAHFDLPTVLLRCIDSNENEALLREYKKGQTIFKDVRERLSAASTTAERRNARLLNRVWNEVERIMKRHEARIWRQMEDQRHVDFEATAKLANFLLDVGVDTNPYHRAYIQHNLRIKETTTRALQRDRTRIEVLRRNSQLRHVDSKVERLEALSVFVEAELSPSETTPNILQSQEVLGIWSAVDYLVDDVWSSPVASVVENWRIMQDMTNTRSVKLLPNGPDGASRKFHAFTPQERETATTRTEETIELLCNSLADFFVSKPITELPSIYSPVSATPFTETEDAPELPDMGGRDAAEFSFIAPAVNSLGACSHLTKIMTRIMSGVAQLRGLKISAKADDHLQKTVTVVRERFIRAICELWQVDSDDLPYLELWKRSSVGDGTNFPKIFWVVQKVIIDGISRIMFRSELMPLPSQRLLSNVRQQFVKNVYQVINGLMTFSYSSSASPLLPNGTTVDVEVKKLMTINNLRTIQSSTLLKLVQTLETTFSLSLTPDLQKMNAMFAQYIQKLLASFLSPRLTQLEDLVRHDVGSTPWHDFPTPSDVGPWAPKAVLTCVTAHALISMHAPVLLRELVDAMVAHLFRAYKAAMDQQLKEGRRITSGGVLQVSLDAQFLANQFSTSMSREAQVTMDEILASVEESKRNDNIGAEGTTEQRAEVKRILARAGRRWSAHAEVFRGPLLASPTRR